MMDFLGDASRAHFDGLQRLLASQKIEFRLNPRLVRGLDYYNLTVFEWISGRLGAQGTVCGGGRYDGLFAQLGGKPAPATGFAMGNERLIALMAEAKVRIEVKSPAAYVLHQGEGTLEFAFSLGEMLRQAGLNVVMHAGGGSFKSQMKKADASGALYALLIGEDELKAGKVTVKPLRSGQPQYQVAREHLAAKIKES
jgi:histidyl-tRNA synthetase